MKMNQYVLTSALVMFLQPVVHAEDADLMLPRFVEETVHAQPVTQSEDASKNENKENLQQVVPTVIAEEGDKATADSEHQSEADKKNELMNQSSSSVIAEDAGEKSTAAVLAAENDSKSQAGGDNQKESPEEEKKEMLKKSSPVEIAAQEITLEQMMQQAEPTVRHMYQQAQTLYTSGSEMEAAGVLEDVLHVNAKFLPARELLAKILLDHGQVMESYHMLEIGHNQYPNNSEIVVLMSQAMTAMNQSDYAIRLLEKHPPAMQKAKDYYAMLSVLYLNKENYKAALHYYQELAAHFPDDKMFVVGQAIAADKMHNREFALATYKSIQDTGSMDIALVNYINERIDVLGKELATD